MKIKNIVNNFHLLTESQRLPNMFGQRLYNMLGQRLLNMLGQRLYNILGQHFLDEQSEDGFASRNQRWPNENCSLKPNVGPTSTCYLSNVVLTHEIITFQDFCAENSNEFEAAEYNCWWSWNQTQQKIALNFHLLAPARGTSHRIMPAQLLNRQRISSSSTNISSEL